MPLGSTTTINLLNKRSIKMNKHLSIFNQLRPVTVGFDNIFDHFESMFDNEVFQVPQVNYPPYNIVKTGSNTYDIEVALAGFSKNDIEVAYFQKLYNGNYVNMINLGLDNIFWLNETGY